MCRVQETCGNAWVQCDVWNVQVLHRELRGHSLEVEWYLQPAWRYQDAGPIPSPPPAASPWTYLVPVAGVRHAAPRDPSPRGRGPTALADEPGSRPGLWLLRGTSPALCPRRSLAPPSFLVVKLCPWVLTGSGLHTQTTLPCRPGAGYSMRPHWTDCTGLPLASSAFCAPPLSPCT